MSVRKRPKAPLLHSNSNTGELKLGLRWVSATHRLSYTSAFSVFSSCPFASFPFAFLLGLFVACLGLISTASAASPIVGVAQLLAVGARAPTWLWGKQSRAPTPRAILQTSYGWSDRAVVSTASLPTNPHRPGQSDECSSGTTPLGVKLAPTFLSAVALESRSACNGTSAMFSVCPKESSDQARWSWKDGLLPPTLVLCLWQTSWHTWWGCDASSSLTLRSLPLLLKRQFCGASLDSCCHCCCWSDWSLLCCSPIVDGQVSSFPSWFAE